MCSAAAQCRERRRFFCERGGVLDGDVGASVFLGRLASRRLSDAHFSSLLASFESCFLCLGAAGAASLVVTVGLLELARRLGASSLALDATVGGGLRRLS